MVRFLSKTLTLKRLAENDVKTCKMTSKCHNRRPDIMHKSRLTHPRVRRHFLVPVEFIKIPVGSAGNDLSALVKIAENHLESNAGDLGYFLLLGNEINVRFLDLPSQSTGRAFLLCNREENLGDHISYFLNFSKIFLHILP